MNTDFPLWRSNSLTEEQISVMDELFSVWNAASVGRTECVVEIKPSLGKTFRTVLEDWGYGCYLVNGDITVKFIYHVMWDE